MKREEESLAKAGKGRVIEKRKEVQFCEAFFSQQRVEGFLLFLFKRESCREIPKKGRKGFWACATRSPLGFCLAVSILCFCFFF